MDSTCLHGNVFSVDDATHVCYSKSCEIVPQNCGLPYFEVDGTFRSYETCGNIDPENTLDALAGKTLRVL